MLRAMSGTMCRWKVCAVATTWFVAGCGEATRSDGIPGELAGAFEADGARLGTVQRHPLPGDIGHYELAVRVAETPNGVVHVHRVVRERGPWAPAATRGGLVLVAGDGGTFVSSFVPQVADPATRANSLALHLAEQGFDVWGYDRRWTRTRARAERSDFAAMGLVEETREMGRALSMVRRARVASGGAGDRLVLVAVGCGAQIGYLYASQDGALPEAEQNLKAFAAVDAYAEIAPGEQDLRAATCAAVEQQRLMIAGGVLDVDSTTLVETAALARTAPDAPSPFVPGVSNRAAMLGALGQTFMFVPYTSSYHLAAGTISGGSVTGLRESAEEVLAAWLEASAPHTPLREIAEAHVLRCGKEPSPIDAPLERIRAPLFYLGAAGGIGDHGLHTTTRVGSTDVSTLVVRRFGPEREAEDFGHLDLLFARDAPALAWAPLADWLRRH
jgi:hypothetical protein